MQCPTRAGDGVRPADREPVASTSRAAGQALVPSQQGRSSAVTEERDPNRENPPALEPETMAPDQGQAGDIAVGRTAADDRCQGMTTVFARPPPLQVHAAPVPVHGTAPPGRPDAAAATDPTCCWRFRRRCSSYSAHKSVQWCVPQLCVSLSDTAPTL